MVGSKVNGTLDDRRVSEQTWVHEDDSADAERISERMDYFLDLETRSTNHSELFQVANYGLAGQYSCHYDQVLMDKRHIQNREVFNIYAGDRMLTLMGYLSDVLAGGYTVTSIEAEPSNAALWNATRMYNGWASCARRLGRAKRSLRILVRMRDMCSFLYTYCCK